jgi:hypothetical protein
MMRRLTTTRRCLRVNRNISDIQYFSTLSTPRFTQNDSLSATATTSSSSTTTTAVAPAKVVVQNVVSDYFKPTYQSRYIDAEVGLDRPRHKIILTLEELGAATTEHLYKVVTERYPDAFESKCQFKKVLKELKEKRRIDAKPNPFKDVLKKFDSGFVHALTTKQKRELLKKRRELYNQSQQQTTTTTETTSE